MIVAQRQWPSEGDGRRARETPDCPVPAAGATIADMPHVAFTSQLQRFTQTPELHTSARTLREALEAAFDINPRLRHYVLDEQGHLRPHVVVFIDGRRAVDRITLTDALAPDDQVYVLQALTGG
jgi:sulfur-carrier protein